MKAQSREEIFADKLIAFALRQNRLKNRDLWDIAWLHQQQTKPALNLVKQKLDDHHAEAHAYLQAFGERTASLKHDPDIAPAFRKEMSRFLPKSVVHETVNSTDFWEYLSNLMYDYHRQLTQILTGDALQPAFKM